MANDLSRADRRAADELERVRARREYIRKIVNAAPPLTPEQIGLLRRLMGPNSPAARAAAAAEVTLAEAPAAAETRKAAA